MEKTCILVLLANTLTIVSCVNGCRNGWIQHENSCYLFKHTDFSWNEAMLHCKILGGTLAEVNTVAENQFLEQETKTLRYGGRYWIGAIDSEIDGVWTWATSNGKLTFFDWSPGQPDDAGGNEDCLEIAENFKWNDRPCHTPQGFICEHILDAPVVG